MSVLSQSLSEYLMMRRIDGAALRSEGFVLRNFVLFMDERGLSTITLANISKWLKQRTKAKPVTLVKQVCFIRDFARFRKITDSRTEIPALDFIPMPLTYAERCKRKVRVIQEENRNDGHGDATPLHKAALSYLHMRKMLGFKMKASQSSLLNFVAFAEQQGAEFITVHLALEWAQLPSSAIPATWASRLNTVRSFAKYRESQDPRTEAIPLRLLPRSRKRYTPHIYTDEELQNLLSAVLNLPVHTRRSILKIQSFHTLLSLLIVTGMRVGEATNLMLSDVDLNEGIIAISGAKFGQYRFLPLHSTTREALVCLAN